MLYSCFTPVLLIIYIVYNIYIYSCLKGCRTKSFHIKGLQDVLDDEHTSQNWMFPLHTHTFKPAAHSRPKAYPEIRS